MQERHMDFRKLNGEADALTVAWNELRIELDVLYAQVRVTNASEMMQIIIKMQIVVGKNKPSKKLIKALTRRIAEVKSQLAQGVVSTQKTR